MFRALEQIRRMRGGTQSHLMRCSDGKYYEVKFQNNVFSALVLRDAGIEPIALNHFAVWVAKLKPMVQ
jgi:hypothetical protein